MVGFKQNTDDRSLLPMRTAIRGRRRPEENRQVIRLDRRTKVAKALEQFRAELITHSGGTPSATQRVLIERSTQLQARLLQMDAAFAERGEQSEHTAKQYLAWSNSLSRTLRHLGLAGAKEQMPTLANYLAGKTPAAP
jgi:hypothetical protein